MSVSNPSNQNSTIIIAGAERLPDSDYVEPVVASSEDVAPSSEDPIVSALNAVRSAPAHRGAS